jgi:hypothetical protein
MGLNLPLQSCLCPLCSLCNSAPSAILLPLQLSTILFTMGPKKKIKDLSHLYSLVQLEKEPAPLTEEDVKNLLIPSSYKSHAYTMSLWAEYVGPFKFRPFTDRLDSLQTAIITKPITLCSEQHLPCTVFRCTCFGLLKQEPVC